MGQLLSGALIIAFIPLGFTMFAIAGWLGFRGFLGFVERTPDEKRRDVVLALLALFAGSLMLSTVTKLAVG